MAEVVLWINWTILEAFSLIKIILSMCRIETTIARWNGRKNAKQGIVVTGGNGPGSELNQLSSPSGIFVDGRGATYVVDAANDRVVRWAKEAKQGEVIIGGHGRGSQPNQLFQPAGISIDQAGNMYVVDALNQRVQRFDVKMKLWNHD